MRQKRIYEGAHKFFLESSLPMFMMYFKKGWDESTIDSLHDKMVISPNLNYGSEFQDVILICSTLSIPANLSKLALVKIRFRKNFVTCGRFKNLNKENTIVEELTAFKTE